MYQMTCQCGSPIEVKLVQAGLDLTCPRCGNINRVPPSTKLKRLAPQIPNTPNGFRKVLEALQNQSFPFDGNCTLCKRAEDTKTIPMKFDFLLEHHLDDDGSIQTSPPHFVLKQGTSFEKWGHLYFPLNICQNCYDQFQADWKVAKKKRRPRKILIWCLVSPLVLMSMIIAALVPILSTPMVMFSVYFIYRRLTRRKGDPFLLQKLSSIPPISEMLAEEQEYHLRAKSAKPISPDQ